MSIELWTAALFVCLFALMFLNLPVGFALGATGVIFTLMTWGPSGLYMVAAHTWGASNQFVLVSIPLFILMAMILEKSGIADRMFDMMYVWFGPVRGGLAVGTLIICTLFAAMCGISGTATITMATIALPAMLKRGYQKQLAIGCINSGGGWGILMPPSVDMIIYALVAGESVGRMFAGGVLPTIVLLILDSTYILVRAYFQKDLAPALLKEERGTWAYKFTTLRAVILPFAIIFTVLGSILFGFASPTEAAAIGVGASIIAAYKHLTWPRLMEATGKACRISAMIMWIIFGAYCLSTSFQGMGVIRVVQNLMLHVPAGRWGVFAFFMIILFILGMVMSSSGIMLITVPIMLPVIKASGFDTLWFGVVFIVMMELGYMTPPFGYNLFYIRAVTDPKEISMTDIYTSVIWFVCVEFVALVILCLYPEIILWLPNKLFPQ
jgi:tripartite ATP-independent transporter DctM subunit